MAPLRKSEVGRDPIRADAAYGIELFAALTGVSESGLRKAERQGLKAAFVGRRKFIRGAAWIEFLAAREKLRESDQE